MARSLSREQFMSWKGSFTRTLNCITSGEVPPLVENVVNHWNIQTCTTPPNKRGINSANNALTPLLPFFFFFDWKVLSVPADCYYLKFMDKKKEKFPLKI